MVLTLITVGILNGANGINKGTRRRTTSVSLSSRGKMAASDDDGFPTDGAGPAMQAPAPDDGAVREER